MNKIQAVLICKNDFKRLEFTLSHFTAVNKNIPITVLNANGDDPSHIVAQSPGLVSVRRVGHLMHTKMTKGIVTLEWFLRLYEYGVNPAFTHLLYLETDVLTNRAITKLPDYDMAGPLGRCDPFDLPLWDYFGFGNDPHKVHTGCGGTIFRREFFERLSPNLHLIDKAWEEMPEHFFGDMVMTLIGRKSGSTVGWWEETSNVGGHYVIEGDSVRIKECDLSATLVHNYKV